MSRIFLSYRRAEHPALIGRIYDRLVSEFGKDSVFLDVDSIPLGIDFEKHLQEQVSQCEVFVSVIGKEWVTRMDSLYRNDDFIRIEILWALQCNKPIIPLLVEVQMPSSDRLPDELMAFVGRNGMKLDPGQDFHIHMARFIGEVSKYMNSSAPHPAVHIKSTSLLVANVIDGIQEMLENPGRVSGASSGFESLDRYTNGFEPTNTYVFAAEPNSGLTSLLISITDRILAQDRYSVMWIETSTDEESVMMKLMFNMSAISPAMFRRGLLSRVQQECLAKSTRYLQRSRLTIVSSPEFVDGLLSELFLTGRELRPDIIIIDEFTGASQASPEGAFVNLARLARLARVALICGVKVAPTAKNSAPTFSFNQSNWAQEIMQSATFIGWLSSNRESQFTSHEAEKADSSITVLLNKKGPLGATALNFWPDFCSFSSELENQVGAWSWVVKAVEEEMRRKLESKHH